MMGIDNFVLYLRMPCSYMGKYGQYSSLVFYEHDSCLISVNKPSALPSTSEIDTDMHAVALRKDYAPIPVLQILHDG